MGLFSKPRKPKATAEELALGKRQRLQLDKEIEESEGRQKLLSRGSVGRRSLLSGAARTRVGAANKKSLLGSSGTGSSGGGSITRGR